jgi:hypothetical protein
LPTFVPIDCDDGDDDAAMRAAVISQPVGHRHSSPDVHLSFQDHAASAAHLCASAPLPANTSLAFADSTL